MLLLMLCNYELYNVEIKVAKKREILLMCCIYCTEILPFESITIFSYSYAKSNYARIANSISVEIMVFYEDSFLMHLFIVLNRLLFLITHLNAQ